jgi:hypothetical protein
MAIAAVTAAQGLPWLVAGAGRGVLVDRSDRRQLMVTVDVVRAAVIAGLAVAILAHHAGLPLIYLTAVVAGGSPGTTGTPAAAGCEPVAPGDQPAQPGAQPPRLIPPAPVVR